MRIASLFDYLEKIVATLLCISVIFVLHRIGLLQTLATGVSRTPIWDFEIYYQLSKDVLAGVHPYQVSYMQTLGPPLVIAPFILFSLFPLTIAVKLYFVGSLVCAGISVYLLAKYFQDKYVVLISLVLFLFLLTSFPARFTIIVGQPHFYILLLVVVVLLPFNSHLKTFAALMLLVFKTFFVFPLLGLLFHKKLSWQALVVAITLGLSSLLLIKPQYYFDFVQQKLGSVLFTQSQSEGIDYYNQSLRASLGRVELEGLYPVLVILIVAIVIWATVKQANYEVAVMGSIILSPVLWQHYLVMVFPIVVLLMPRVIKDWKLSLLWVIAAGLWWIEFPWIHSSDMNVFNRIVASHYLISLIILMGLSLLTWERQENNQASHLVE